MEYIINIWCDSISVGTACVYRSTNRNEFEEEKKKWIQKIKPHNKICRLSVFEKHVIFSYAENPTVFHTWLNMKYFKKPLAVRYIKTKEILT